LRYVRRHDGIRVAHVPLVAARDGLRELLGGLQGRRVEQSLQHGAPARTASGAPGVQARDGGHVRDRFQARPRRQHLAPERAVFTSDYTNMQVTYRGPAPNGVAPFITNAGKASIDGLELETTWAPNDAWTVDASFGY